MNLLSNIAISGKQMDNSPTRVGFLPFVTLGFCTYFLNFVPSSENSCPHSLINMSPYRCLQSGIVSHLSGTAFETLLFHTYSSDVSLLGCWPPPGHHGALKPFPDFNRRGHFFSAHHAWVLSQNRTVEPIFFDLGGHFRFGGSVQETISDEHPGNIVGPVVFRDAQPGTLPITRATRYRRA